MLEIEQAAQCVGAEHAVDLPCVEPQRVQPRLKFSDVVPAHHRNPPVENSVTEPIAGIHQRAPSLGADDAVDRKAARLLEVAHGRFGGLTEHAGLVSGDLISQRRKPALNVQNRLPTVAEVVEPHELNGCRSTP